MSEPIHAHRGVIDKYIGDAIMAYWGPPFVEEAEQAHFACLAAVDMVGRVATLRRELPELLGVRTIPAECDIRIGIATGEALVGSIGSRVHDELHRDGRHREPRLAARRRQQGLWQPLPDLGRRPPRCARPTLELREIDRLVVVGQSQPQTVYEIMGKKGELTSVAGRRCELATWKAWRPTGRGAGTRQRRAFTAALNAVPGDGPSMAMIARIIGASRKIRRRRVGTALASR